MVIQSDRMTNQGIISSLLLYTLGVQSHIFRIQPFQYFALYVVLLVRQSVVSCHFPLNISCVLLISLTLHVSVSVHRPNLIRQDDLKGEGVIRVV